MDKHEPNSLLSPFLRKLADDIDKKKLSPEEMQRIGEFYISWVFYLNLDEQEEEISDKDFTKFLTMGWYVYKQLLKSDTI